MNKRDMLAVLTTLNERRLSHSLVEIAWVAVPK
jgi:hypothetical protein